MAGIVCAVLFVFGMVRVFALPGLSLKVQTTKFNTVTDGFTPVLRGGESLSQTFATDRTITSVAVLPDLRACKGGAMLRAVLADKNGTPLASAEAEAADSDAQEPPYVHLVFDTPVQGNPADGPLTLTLTVTPLAGTGAVRFYKSVEVQTRTGMGELFVKGRADAGSLTLIAETGSVRGFITPFFVVLTLLCALALCAVYAAARIAGWPLHKVYLTALLCLGLLYMLVIPPYGVTDEAQHINQAYNNSARVLGLAPKQIPWGDAYRRACDTNSALEQNATTVFSYQELVQGLLRGAPGGQSDTVVYKAEEVGGYQLPYVLSSLGVLLGRLLHLGYVPTLLLGRLFNFALFAALTYFAVKHAPFGNAVFAAVGLLPGTLHVAASFSRDSFTLALAFLFTALTLRAAGKKELLHWREGAVLAVLCVLLAPCKAAYVPLVLLLLLIPAARFGKAWQAWTYRAGVLCTAGFLYWRANIVIVWDAAMKSTDHYETAAAANPDAITYSLSYLLTHIKETLALLVNTAVQNGTHYLDGLVGGTLGNDNLALSWTFIAAFFVLLVLAVQRGHGSNLLRLSAWRTSVPVWLALLGCCGLVVVGCVFWTPTYYTTIYGMQGRYFLPVLPLLLLLCKPRGKAGAEADGAMTQSGAAIAQERADTALLLAFAVVQVCTVLNIFYVVALR